MKKASILFIGILSVALVAATACASSLQGEPPARRPMGTTVPVGTIAPVTPTATPDLVPTNTPVAGVPTPSDPTVSDDAVPLSISVEGDALEFNKSSLSVSAGSEVALTFENVSSAFQHNWVLVPDGAKDEVSIAGTTAGPANGWVSPGDERVLAKTTLLDPGQSGVASFPAPPAGTYQFVCTFPGHNATMFGSFEVTN